MEPSHATIRPLIIHKRKSSEAFQRPPQPRLYSKVSLPEITTKTGKDGSRRFSLPIQTIPEVSQLAEETAGLIQDGGDQDIDSEGLHTSRSSLEQTKNELIKKAKELERGAYSALFQAEYLRWQAENDCRDHALNSNLPTALSLKAEELGLRLQDFSLNSKSTVSLRSSESLFDQQPSSSSLSGRGLMFADSSRNFLNRVPTSPTWSTSNRSSTCSPGHSRFTLSSITHDDPQLKPILRPGNRTLKKAQSRVIASRNSVQLQKHPERRLSFTESNTCLLKNNRRFRIKCPFSLLFCCYRRKKYQSCGSSADAF